VADVGDEVVVRGARGQGDAVDLVALHARFPFLCFRCRPE
jgi:hypothetical protein